MPTTALTEKTIRSASGPVELWDKHLPGFGIRVGRPSDRWAKGRKTWQAMYRVNGSRKQRLKLGNFPEMPLASARGLAKRTLERAQSGEDPKALLIEQRQDANYTVDTLAHDYVKKYARRHNRRWKEKQKQLERYVIPAWGSRAANSIVTRDVAALIDDLLEIGPATARLVYANIRHMFAWAADRGQIAANPCTTKAHRGQGR